MQGRHLTQRSNIADKLAKALKRRPTEEEITVAYAEEMRRRRLMRTDYTNPGGFKHLKDTGQYDKLAEMSEKALKARWKKDA